ALAWLAIAQAHRACESRTAARLWCEPREGEHPRIGATHRSAASPTYMPAACAGSQGRATVRRARRLAWRNQNRPIRPSHSACGERVTTWGLASAFLARTDAMDNSVRLTRLAAISIIVRSFVILSHT